MGVANITSARAKLRRANEHLDALEAAMTRALNDVSNASRLEFGRDGPWHLIIFHPDGYPIEQTHRWATMMGDAINNTRAALDHTVWQLILREDKKPGKTNYFPLFTDRQEFLNKVKAPPKQFKKRSPCTAYPSAGTHGHSSSGRSRTSDRNQI